MIASNFLLSRRSRRLRKLLFAEAPILRAYKYGLGYDPGELLHVTRHMIAARSIAHFPITMGATASMA
jgi:hypothetical protein